MHTSMVLRQMQQYECAGLGQKCHLPTNKQRVNRNPVHRLDFLHLRNISVLEIT